MNTATYFSRVLACALWTGIAGPAAAHDVRPATDQVTEQNRRIIAQAFERWADGDHVIVRWDGSATAGDGAPYHNSYVWIFRMANGRAAEVTAFLDLAPYDDVIRRVPLGKKP